MPRPRSERQSLEEELAELPGQLAGYRRELVLTPAEDKTRWEFLEWQIQRAQNRRATIEGRLAAIQADGAEGP
jgi:chromosome segregation ATPase